MVCSGLQRRWVIPASLFWHQIVRSATHKPPLTGASNSSRKTCAWVRRQKKMETNILPDAESSPTQQSNPSQHGSEATVWLWPQSMSFIGFCGNKTSLSHSLAPALPASLYLWGMKAPCHTASATPPSPEGRKGGLHLEIAYEMLAVSIKRASMCMVLVEIAAIITTHRG